MDNQHDYPPDAHLPPTPPRQYLKQYTDPANYPNPTHFPSPPSYPPVPPLVPSGSSSTSTRSSAYASPGPSAVLSSNDLSTLIGRYAPDHDSDVYDVNIGAAITTDKAVPPAVPRSLSYPRLVQATDPTPPPPTIGWSDPYTPSNHSPGSSYDTPNNFPGSPEPVSVRSMPYAPQGPHEHSQQSPIIDDDPPLPRRRPPIRTSSSHSASISGLTSEDDTDADQDPEQDSFDFENARTAAVVVAEEGRGLIVHGEGLGVSALNIQPGTTHLLLSSLATPNSLPALLTNTLPAISATLLALDVSANFLSALPPALASCTRLTELNVASNPLRALPVWLARLTDLRVLIADATGISTLPVELGTLRALNILSLRRNRLMSLPAWLANLPGLEHLSIEGNPFQGPWQALLAPLTDRFPTSISSPYSGSNTNSTYATNSMYSATPTSAYVTPSTASLPTDEPPSSVSRYEEEDHTIVPGRGQLSTKSPTPAAPVALGSRSSQNSSGMLPTGSPSMLPYMRTAPPNTFSKHDTFLSAHARSASPLLRTRTTPGRPNMAAIDRRSGSASILTERGARPRSSTSSDAQRPHTDFVRRVDDSGYYDSRRSDGSEFFGGTVEEEEDQHKKALRRMRSADELRRALESVIGPSEPAHQPAKQDVDNKITAPSADVQPFVARLESGSARHTVAPQESPGPRRFATMQTIPTRPRTRPSLSDAVWDAEDEADDPAPKSAKQGKWGFLKKMSMGRMRTEPSPPANTSASKFARRIEMSSPPRSEPQIPTLQSSSPRPGGRAPSQSPALPTPPASATLLGPPQQRSAKRRSFLPLDGPPMLNIPIPKTDTGALLAESVIPTNDDAQTPSEAPDRPSSQVPARSTSETRALKSVMAYLRDMADLDMAPAPPEGARVASEGFSTRSGGTRSDDQHAKTMSVMTTDSSGSGGREEDRSRHKDDKTKRALIVKEIIETERTYVKGLQELIEIYVKPASQSVNTLGNAVAATKETVVPAPERKIVFNGLDSLLSFHKQSFLPSLERAALARGPGTDGESEGDHSLAAAQAIANVFLSHAAFMRMYSSYINNFDNAVNRLKQWTTERRPTTASPGSSLVSPNSSTVHLVGMSLQMSIPGGGVGESQPTGGMAPLSSSQRRRIKSYLKRCRMNPQHSQLNLEGYLLLPVQRIPRYRLMLEELVRCTSPAVDAYDDPLDRALTEITSLANNMNEGKRESESRRRLVQWQSRIRGKFPSPLVQPHRRLIMDGGLHLTRVVRKSAMAFDVVNPSGEVSNVQVECLAPEETPRSLVGILCNDLLVLCKDPSAGKDHTSQVDLWAVLRMQTLPQPASIVHGSALRVVDNRAILYFNAPSTSDALTWCRAINMHIPASKP